MNSRISGSALGLAWVLLLVGELEYLLVTHYAIRTSIRQLLHLPVYHVLLTFISLACLTLWIDSRQLRLFRVRLCVRRVLVHAGCYLLLSAKLDALWRLSQGLPPLAAVLLWMVLGLLLLVSWFASLLQIDWAQLSEPRRLRWIGATLLVSLLAPYVAQATAAWWNSFSSLTFVITEFFLQLWYPDTVGDVGARVLGTSRFVIVIEPGCSGYEGMGLIALLVGFYLMLKHPRPGELGKEVWLIPLSMGLAWLANIARLVALVVLGAEVSPELALRGFHSQAGWLSFTLLGFGLIALRERQESPELVGEDSADRPEGQGLPGACFLAPQMGIIFAGMVGAAFSTDFNYLYPLKAIVGAALLASLRSRFAGLLTRPGAWAALVGVGVYCLWLALSPPTPAVSPFDRMDGPLAGGWVALRCLGAVLVVPLAEELAFRGYLMRRLQAFDFEQVEWRQVRIASLLVSSVLFGVMHANFFAGLVAGLAYGWVTGRQGYFANAVAAHALTNLLLCIHVMLNSRWDLWS